MERDREKTQMGFMGRMGTMGWMIDQWSSGAGAVGFPDGCSFSWIYFLVAAGKACQMVSARMPPIAAKGIRNSGHQIQPCADKRPMPKDCRLLPR